MDQNPDRSFDIIIIGAGITGAFIARTLSRYHFSILLIEREADVGMGSSGANSAILHAGYDPRENSMKAAMNVRGNELWNNAAVELGVPMLRVGSFVAAVGSSEVPDLEKLYRRGLANGVKGLRLLNRDEALEKIHTGKIPFNPAISGALWAPTAGIIDPFAAVLAACENAVDNGVTLLTGTAFQEFVITGQKIAGIKTSRGEFSCRWAINCAGLNCDEVMHKAGVRPDYRIKPRKGSYFVFDSSKIAIGHVLFQVPTEKGKGILVTTTVHGNMMIGPNAEPAENKEDASSSRESQDAIISGARKIVPELKTTDIIAEFTGIRATGNESDHPDFIIEIPQEIQGLVNLGGIESPGLASAPAIAERVRDLLKDAGETLEEKREYNPVRIPRPRFKHLNHEERAWLVKNRPEYGRIVCRCEEVTEGELLAELRSSVPPRTYDGLKRRTWLGTGRCQGAFDIPRSVEILARELGCEPETVTKKGPGSEFLFRKTKEF